MVRGQRIFLLLASIIGAFGEQHASLARRQGYISDCTYTIVAIDGDTCETLADWGSITVEQFKSYNPQLSDCNSLNIGTEYCLEKNYGQPDPPPTTTVSSSLSSTLVSTTRSLTTPPLSSSRVTSASVPTSSTKSFVVAPPAPTQTGVASNCNKWDVIKDGDTCDVYLRRNPGVTLANLVAWNPAIGSTCGLLGIGSAICVSVEGFVPRTTVATSIKPTSTINPTSSSIPGAVPAPGPTQPGVAPNCNRWDVVSDGATCETFTNKYPGVTLTNLVSWNPAIGDQCGFLWLDFYVCTSVVGFTAPTKTTSTKPATTSTKTTPTPTSSVPSPVQSGINSNCKKYHKVVSGDGCYDLATKYKIALADFYRWNPSVKNDCSGLWVAYYVCVGI